MKSRCLPLAAALAMAVLPCAASAQTSAPPPVSAASASAPSTIPPGPRLQTPAQRRDSASPPGDLRPERPVTKQLSIPLGKNALPPSKSEARAARRGSTAASGGIDDSAARCEARADEQERASCRDQLTSKPIRR